MKKFNVISIGSCVRDIIFYTDKAEFIKNPKNDPTKIYLLGFEYGAKIKSDEVYYSFGGGAANTAINFAGLGLKVGVIAALGNDGFGAEIKSRLKNKKVNTELLQIKKNNHTGLSFLVVDKKSNEHFILVSYGANNTLEFNKSINTDWYYVSSLGGKNWSAIMDKIVKTKKKIAWNPGATQLQAGYGKLKKYFSKIEVLILNKDEAIELCLSAKKKGTIAKMLKIIHQWGPKKIVITDGEKGAYVYDGKKIYFDRPHHKKPKDTTGAGDCFGSTFITGLIKTKGDIIKSMRLAIRNTTSLVFTPGAQEGLLNWKQLNK
jgi:sugar/nucleoside kinase (ribokinase family)